MPVIDPNTSDIRVLTLAGVEMKENGERAIGGTLT